MNILIIDNINNYYTNNKIRYTNKSIVSLYVNTLKYIGCSVNTMNGNDASFSKEAIFQTILQNKINKLIINVNIDNFKSISRFKIKENFQDTEVILLSINEDIHDYLNPVEYDKYILFNEKFDFEFNIDLFLRNLNIQNNIHELKVAFDTNDILLDKSPIINIGTGCSRGCKFCSISNSKIKYRAIDDIIDEIRIYLNQGNIYFHIINHNFTYDMKFVEEFCQRLISEFSDYLYTWSCFVIPEEIINHLHLIPLLKKSKLEKMELSVESGSIEILQDMGIASNSEMCETIIVELLKSNITSIGLNFIIGTYKEDWKTLKQTKEFIFKMLDISFGTCDINLYCFYPEIGSIYFDSDLNKIEGQNLIDIVHCREGFVSDSIFITKKELFVWRYNLNKEIARKRKDLICEISLKVMYKHFELSEYNIYTQLYIQHLSKLNLNNLYKLKKGNQGIYFSWEIKKDFDNYTPVLISIGLLIQNDKKYLIADPNLSKGGQSNMIEFESEALFDYLKEEITIKEIIQRISFNTRKDVSFVKSEIYKTLSMLENSHLLYFKKNIN